MARVTPRWRPTDRVMSSVLIAQLVVIGFTFFMLLNLAACWSISSARSPRGSSSATARISSAAGCLQPLADIIKLMMKEELRPKAADTFLFYLAPISVRRRAFAAFSVVPFGADTTFFGLLDEPIHLPRPTSTSACS
jgi:NADH-quinone oxidoreductase subunit H